MSHWILALATMLVTVFVGFSAWVAFGAWRFRAYHRYKGLEVPEHSLPRYVGAEIRSVLTLVWWQVRAAFSDRLRIPRGSITGPPVVCIHGITQDGSNMWGIRRALERRGRATRAVSMGRIGWALRRHVDPVARALRETLAASPDGTVDVVAHSLGGVVLRLVLVSHPELAGHIRRVVTLGSPHARTAFTRGLPGWPTLRSLGRRGQGTLPGIPSAQVTTIAGIPDFLVYPTSTSHLPDAHTVELPGVSHIGLLTRRDAIHAVVVAITA